jgi:ABC-2 type transport system permease protein
MIRIFDIAAKDLVQLLRDRKTFLFFLIMPVAFTFLFGYAFGGFGNNNGDPRLPVGFVDQDNSSLSQELRGQLKKSKIIRLVETGDPEYSDLQARVAYGNLAAAMIVPARYGHEILHGKPSRLILIGDSNTAVGTSIESEVLTAIIHLDSAVQSALILEDALGDKAPYDHTLKTALTAWEDPPIRVVENVTTALEKENDTNAALAHTAPGMMLQFAIAGLLVSAQVIVSERKTRSLQRLLTTATRRVHILLGHYLAIFVLIFSQFLILIAFGQLILKLNYMAQPLAILVVTVSAAMCIAALGLLIGILAKSEEQAIVFSLIPMFVLAGLGGAWVPLEVTGATFQAIGHLSPIAWAMDGFKNISARGLGFESVLPPAAALIGYATLFFSLGVWRFRNNQEQQ